MPIYFYDDYFNQNFSPYDFRVNDFVKIISVTNIPFASEYGFKQLGEYVITDVGYEFGDYYIKLLNYINNEVLHIYEEDLKWVQKTKSVTQSGTNNNYTLVSKTELDELIGSLEDMNKNREIDRSLVEGNKNIFLKLTGSE